MHTAAWAAEVADRLNGDAPKEPEAGDWPASGEAVDVEGWEDALQKLFNSRDMVVAAARNLDDSDLDSTSGTSLHPSPQATFSRAGLIAGLAQHNAYHAGQIGLLKKMIRTMT